MKVKVGCRRWKMKMREKDENEKREKNKKREWKRRQFSSLNKNSNPLISLTRKLFWYTDVMENACGLYLMSSWNHQIIFLRIIIKSDSWRWKELRIEFVYVFKNSVSFQSDLNGFAKVIIKLQIIFTRGFVVNTENCRKEKSNVWGIHTWNLNYLIWIKSKTSNSPERIQKIISHNKNSNLFGQNYNKTSTTTDINCFKEFMNSSRRRFKPSELSL